MFNYTFFFSKWRTRVSFRRMCYHSSHAPGSWKSLSYSAPKAKRDWPASHRRALNPPSRAFLAWIWELSCLHKKHRFPVLCYLKEITGAELCRSTDQTDLMYTVRWNSNLLTLWSKPEPLPRWSHQAEIVWTDVNKESRELLVSPARSVFSEPTTDLWPICHTPWKMRGTLLIICVTPFS